MESSVSRDWSVADASLKRGGEEKGGRRGIYRGGEARRMWGCCLVWVQ